MQPDAIAPWRRPLGARPIGDGTVEFRVWAPRADEVAVELDGRQGRLEPAGNGVFEARHPAQPGDDYWLVLDGDRRLPDPCSRQQPDGAGGPSRIVDCTAFTWSDAGWRPPPLDELVLYELHVGAFSPDGTFDGVREQLARLRDLGVTAIELMPIATFAGERNWGYDSIYVYSPHERYGGPEGLQRLVDASHAAGIAVILDVVYNHLGPGSDALTAFGPYFSRRRTPWGPALRFDGRESGAVREWVLQSACQWVRDYHVDGFRLDAVWAMVDDSPTHIVSEISTRARGSTDRDVIVSAEADPRDPRLRADRLEWGIDLWWADAFHHALHALLTGERSGYYAGFGTVGDLAGAFEQPASPRLAVYGQNHDQVGNRPLGDRLTPAASLLAAFTVLFAPFVPLLFMGEEYGEQRPFPFFADLGDPGQAARTRAGRRRGLRELGFDAEPLDPERVETFAASILAPRAGSAETTDRYRNLIELRRSLPAGEARATVEGSTLRVRRGDHELVCNFSQETSGVHTGAAGLVLDTGGVRHDGSRVDLPPFGAAILQDRA